MIARSKLLLIIVSLTLLIAGLSAQASSNNVGYARLNLVSDLTNAAFHVDSRLVNPWAIVAGSDSVWVNDNGMGLITAYGPFGTPFRQAI